MQSNRLFFAAFLLASIISVGSIYKVFTEKSEYRLFYKGDSNSELYAYTAGLNFAKHGFTPLFFLPAHRYEASYDVLLRRGLYTHVPPGPDLVSGGLQKVGVGGFYEQKAWILALNVMTMLFLAAAIRHILPAERNCAPLVILSLALPSAWFVWWAGNLHEHAYLDLLMAFGFWAVVTQRRGLFLLACFVAPFFSFELVPWLFVLGIFFASQRAPLRNGGYRPALAFAATMGGLFLLALGLHLFQNACYFHSLSAAIDDLLSAFQIRSGVTASVGVNTYSFAKHLAKFAYSSLWLYGTGVLILAGIGLTTAIRKKLWLPIVLLCAALPWQIVFRQHCMIHAFTARHFGIGLFVLATIGFIDLWRQVPWKRSLAVLLLFIALVRLPAGCEISNNPLSLAQLRRVIAQTDSRTIAELLYFFKDNPEHSPAKRILIEALALRHGVPPGQSQYTFVMEGNPPVTLAQLEPGWSVAGRNLPEDKLPIFRDQELAYVDIHGPVMTHSDELPDLMAPVTAIAADSETGTPIVISINGSLNQLRFRFLLAWLLLV